MSARKSRNGVCVYFTGFDQGFSSENWKGGSGGLGGCIRFKSSSMLSSNCQVISAPAVLVSQKSDILDGEAIGPLSP